MTLRVAQVQEVVRNYYGLSRSELLEDCRQWRFSHPRQMAIALSFEFAPKVSTTLMGRLFKRDHTTCLHALDRVEERAQRSPQVLRDLSELRARLRAVEAAEERRQVADVWERAGAMLAASAVAAMEAEAA